MIAKFADLFILFIDYNDIERENITIKLLKIEIRTGSGRVNNIITVDRKRSIIRIRNKDKSNCCSPCNSQQRQITRYIQRTIIRRRKRN